jgi:glucosamine--fructose-6-phosphate aminotransferase (isomerizing)
MSADEPETVVAARHQSPLVVRLGEGENFLASAAQALLGSTRKVLFVENGEIVGLTGSTVEVQTLWGESVEREGLPRLLRHASEEERFDSCS